MTTQTNTHIQHMFSYTRNDYKSGHMWYYGHNTCGSLYISHIYITYIYHQHIYIPSVHTTDTIRMGLYIYHIYISPAHIYPQRPYYGHSTCGSPYRSLLKVLFLKVLFYVCASVLSDSKSGHLRRQCPYCAHREHL